MADRMDIQNVLSQMRTMKLQSQGPEALVKQDQADPTRLQSPSDAPSFQELMTDALDTVTALQKESGRLQTAIERGDEGVTLTQAMIASQKASVAFQAVSEARNKLINAYEKIMNMPV